MADLRPRLRAAPDALPAWWARVAAWSCASYVVTGVVLLLPGPWAWPGAGAAAGRAVGVGALALAVVAFVATGLVHGLSRPGGPRRLGGAAALVAGCTVALVVGVAATVLLTARERATIWWVAGWTTGSLPLLVLVLLTRSATQPWRDR